MPPVGLVQTTLSMRDFDCTLSVCHNDDCVKSNHPEESKVLNHAAYPTMRPIPPCGLSLQIFQSIGTI